MCERTKNMLKPIILFSLLLLLIAGVLLPHPLHGDIVNLVEGTKVMGEIVNEDKNGVTLDNSYGTFKIKRSDIVSIVRIPKKMNTDQLLTGTATNENINQLNVKSDLNENARHWTAGQIGFSGTYFYLMGDIANKIPYGYSTHLWLDQELGMFIKKRNPLIPEVRIEGGYLNFQRGSYRMSGFNASGGFVWTFSMLKMLGGSLVFGLLPGEAFLNIENEETGIAVSSNTFTAQALGGYKKTFYGRISLFIHGRYIYIYDNDVFFHTVGGAIGIIYNAW